MRLSDLPGPGDLAPPYDPAWDRIGASAHCALVCLSGQISVDGMGRQAHEIIAESNLDGELADCPESMAELIALAIANQYKAPKAYAVIVRTLKKLTGES